MKKLPAMGALLCAVALPVAAVQAFVVDPSFGPSGVPVWEPEAQTKLGWFFDDPFDPGTSGAKPDWDRYVGDTEPVWDYQAGREAFGNPAQWHTVLPNVDNTINTHKLFWIQYIYERVDDFSGDRAFTSLSWDPFDSYDDWTQQSEMLDASGNVVQDHMLADYERLTISLTMYPNPLYEEIWIGVLPEGAALREVYVVAQCVPEPASFGLVALAGLALIRRRR